MINNKKYKEIKNKLLNMKWNVDVIKGTYTKDIFFTNKDFEIEYMTDRGQILNYVGIKYKSNNELLDIKDCFKKKDLRNLVNELEKIRLEKEKLEDEYEKEQEKLEQVFNEQTFLSEFMGMSLLEQVKENYKNYKEIKNKR